jgi:hypothetical protein
MSSPIVLSLFPLRGSPSSLAKVSARSWPDASSGSLNPSTVNQNCTRCDRPLRSMYSSQNASEEGSDRIPYKLALYFPA